MGKTKYGKIHQWMRERYAFEQGLGHKIEKSKVPKEHYAQIAKDYDAEHKIAKPTIAEIAKDFLLG